MLTLLAAASCKKESGSSVHVPEPVVKPAVPFSVEIAVNAVADSQDLVFGKKYFNESGDDYTVSGFRYYLSNFYFVTANDSIVSIPESYFLVDHQKPASTKLRFDLAAGSYKAAGFIIGVDIARNMSGAQEGALDPANGMFWTWKSGYIMAKLEGRSSRAKLLNEYYFHTGGFAGENSVLQNVLITLDKSYDVSRINKLLLSMNADASEWFKTPHLISLEQLPVAASEGPESRMISENYADMLKLVKISR